MSFFRNRNREGAGKPVPQSGPGRCFALLAAYFWKLVGLNLLFALFSLPVITIPAALCAVNRVCMLIIRNGYCFLWQEFIEEFKRSFKRSLLPAVLFLSLIFFAYYAMSMGLTNAALPLWSMIFWAVGIGTAVVGICWGAYFFALLSLLDLNNKGVLKNAWLLCMVKPGRALTVFAVITAMIFVMAILMPISILLIVSCAAALTQYSVCFLVNSLAEDYILKPFEASRNNE